MKLVSLKMAPEKIKEQSTPAEAEGNPYPWGARITLEDEQVRELGLDGTSVNQKVRLACVAEVINVASTDSKEGGKNLSVSLQIQQMGAQVELSTEDFMRAEVFKGGE